MEAFPSDQELSTLLTESLQEETGFSFQPIDLETLIGPDEIPFGIANGLWPDEGSSLASRLPPNDAEQHEFSSIFHTGPNWGYDNVFLSNTAQMDPHGTDEALLYANTKLILQNFSQFSDPSILDALPPSGPASDLRDGSNDRSESHDLGRTKRRRLQPKAKTILEACFDRHRDDPYIPQNEQRELAAQTGLSLKQIRTFFANARARKLPPPSSQTSDYEPKDNSPTNTYDAAKPAHNASTGTKNIDIPGSTSRDSEQGPMERFLSSSPEDEGISEEAVQRAAESLSSTNFSPPGLRKHSSTTDSISVSDTAFSSNSGSSSSKASIDSANSRGPRRGRKRQRGASQGTLAILLRKPSEPSKIYQCTFCTTDFTQKYDWRRHEESVHFPQKEWVCIPDGPADDASGGGKRCVFCQLQDPSSDHFEEHNCSSCISAPRARRTFTRKDKLQQHLIQVHRLDQCSEITKGWHRPVERSVTLACGFCGIILPDWPVRVDHIASHFNDRIGMDLWMSPPGGIVASGSIDEGTKKRYEVSATVDGEFMCEQCDDRFDNVSHYIFHTRQKHKTYGEEQRNFASVFGTPMFWPKTPTQTGVTDLANQTAAMKLFQHRNPGGMPRLRPPTPLGHRRPSNGSGPMGNGTPSVMPPNPNPSSFFGVSNIHKSSSQSLAANPHANWHTPTKGYPTNVPPQAWDLSLDQRQRVIQSRTGTAKPAEMLPGPEQVSFGYSTMHQPLAEQPQSQLQQNTTTGDATPFRAALPPRLASVTANTAFNDVASNALSLRSPITHRPPTRPSPLSSGSQRQSITLQGPQSNRGMQLSTLSNSFVRGLHGRTLEALQAHMKRGAAPVTQDPDILQLADGHNPSVAGLEPNWNPWRDA